MSISPLETIPPPRLEIVYSADVAPNKKPKTQRPAAQQPVSEPSPASWPLRHWQWIAGAILIPVFYLALEHTIDRRIDTKTATAINGLTTDMGKVREEMARIQTKLDLLLAKNELAEASTLPSAELAQRLPEVREAITTAQGQNVRLPEAELGAIKTKLASMSPDTPEFWPTAFTVLRSLSLSLAKLPRYRETTMYVQDPGKHHRFENLTLILGGNVENVDVLNSWVEFKPDTKLTNVRFYNCVFVLPTSSAPSPELQNIGKVLLASNLKTVTIPSS